MSSMAMASQTIHSAGIRSALSWTLMRSLLPGKRNVIVAPSSGRSALRGTGSTWVTNGAGWWTTRRSGRRALSNEPPAIATGGTARVVAPAAGATELTVVDGAPVSAAWPPGSVGAAPGLTEATVNAPVPGCGFSGAVVAGAG
jgi:hypothetical protein